MLFCHVVPDEFPRNPWYKHLSQPEVSELSVGGVPNTDLLLLLAVGSHWSTGCKSPIGLGPQGTMTRTVPLLSLTHHSSQPMIMFKLESLHQLQQFTLQLPEFLFSLLFW
jgi:hypothetical protein